MRHRFVPGFDRLEPRILLTRMRHLPPRVSQPIQRPPHIMLQPLPPTPPFQEEFFGDLADIFPANTDQLASVVTDIIQDRINDWKSVREIKNKLPGLPKAPKLVLKQIAIGAPKKPRDELRRNARPTYRPMRMVIKRHPLPWRCWIEEPEPKPPPKPHQPPGVSISPRPPETPLSRAQSE